MTVLIALVTVPTLFMTVFIAALLLLAGFRPTFPNEHARSTYIKAEARDMLATAAALALPALAAIVALVALAVAALAALDLAWTHDDAATCHARSDRPSPRPGLHDDLTRPERRPSARPGLRVASDRPPPRDP